MNLQVIFIIASSFSKINIIITGSIGKRFDNIGVENSSENARRYRQLLFTTPNLGEHISGAILYEETFHQVRF